MRASKILSLALLAALILFFPVARAEAADALPDLKPVLIGSTPVPVMDLSGEFTREILTRYERSDRVAAGAYNSGWIDGLGKAHVCGSNDYGQCDVSDWPKVTMIALGDNHAVGLTETGELVFAGSNDMGQCAMDLGGVPAIAVAASPYATYALLQNGALRMCGSAQVQNADFQDVADGIRVSASQSHVAVLRSDGTVVCFGDDARGACRTEDWRDIVMVACGFDFTVAVDRTGLVRVIGSDDYGQRALDGMTDAIGVAAGPNTAFAVLSDGHVRGAGSNSKGQLGVSGWRKIAAVAGGYRHAIGMDFKGMVYAAGDDEQGQLKLY